MHNVESTIGLALFNDTGDVDLARTCLSLAFVTLPGSDIMPANPERHGTYLD
jgi:hypothetical protein